MPTTQRQQHNASGYENQEVHDVQKQWRNRNRVSGRDINLMFHLQTQGQYLLFLSCWQWSGPKSRQKTRLSGRWLNEKVLSENIIKSITHIIQQQQKNLKQPAVEDTGPLPLQPLHHPHNMTTVSFCEVTLVAAEGLLIKGQGRNTFSITGDLCHYQIDALGSCLSFIRNCTYSISINFHKNPILFCWFPRHF